MLISSNSYTSPRRQVIIRHPVSPYKWASHEEAKWFVYEFTTKYTGLECTLGHMPLPGFLTTMQMWTF